MIPRVLLISLLFGLPGCASSGLSQYEISAGQPTPEYWDSETLWVFSLLDQEGLITSVLTVRFTDLPADTCTSGDARRLEIVHEDPSAHPASIGEAAYWLTGRTLTIDLTSNLCDAYTDLRGQLIETGFVGIQESGGMLGGTEIGAVYGVRIPKLD